MNIKEAEKLTGVSSRNIRFYEQKGLLKPTRNAENDYREYSDEEIHRLKLIRALRMVDMPLEQIKQVLDGTLPLQTAAADQKQKIKDQIKRLETSAYFCGELAKPEQNIEEVLMQMDEPKNRKLLSKRWTFDYAEWAKKILLPLGIGLLPMIMGWLLLFPVFLAGFCDAHGYLLALALAQLIAWAVVGYKMCKSKLWPSGAILAHVFALATVILGFLAPENGAWGSIVRYSYLPLDAMNSVLTESEWDIRTLTIWAFCLLVVFFGLGVGAKLLVLRLRGRPKKESPAWVRRIKENAYAHYALVASGYVVLLLALLLMPAFVLDLSPEQAHSPQWLAGKLQPSEEIKEAVIGDMVYIVPDSEELSGMLQIAQWERKYTLIGAGTEVATIYLNTEQTSYLKIYSGGMAELHSGDKFGSSSSYYQMPDEIAEKVKAWLENHPLQT